MRTGPLACAALLLRAVPATPCAGSGGQGGDSCPDVGEDDEEAGLSQLKLRELHKLRQAPDDDDGDDGPAYAQTASSALAAPAPAECPFLSDPSASVPLTQAQACLDMIEGPAAMAKQTMEALVQWYRSFYAFAYIASDPPAGNYSFSPQFADLGIFGGENGGAQPDLSKVDLIGDWEKIAESIPTEGNYSVSKWVAPANSAFTKLRDCHPSVWIDGKKGSAMMAPAMVLGQVFSLQLQDLAGGLVALDISAATDNLTIDGTLAPVVTDKSGNVVKSIDRLPPMQWLVENILESPAMPYNAYCTKSLGGRMNRLVKGLKGMSAGISYTMALVGSLSDLSPSNFSVELEGEGGANVTATWAWTVTTNLATKKLWNCTDYQCVIDAAPGRLSTAGGYRQAVMTPTQVLNETWDDGALGLLSPEPASPRSEPPSLVGTTADAENSSLPEDVFAWLLDPTCTFGYLAFRKRPDGTEFGLFKFTMFTTMVCSDDWETYEANFSAKLDQQWRAFTAEAQSRNVTNLLVDFAGNGGGLTSYAWQFVQMIEPDLPYSKTCGKLNRPIPSAYRLWSQINTLPIEQFMSEELGPGFKQERVNQLKANPEMQAAVINNTLAILETVNGFGLWNTTDLLAEVKAPNKDTAAHVLEKFDLAYTKGHCANPFSGDAFGTYRESQYETAYRFPVLEQRGIRTRNLTAKIYECPPSVSNGLSNPFDDVVFVSDGTCGSSCYLAAGTTWAIARAYTNRSVRFATYGGIGGSIAEAKKTLSPTAFPGGNVNRDGGQMANGMFTCLLVQIGLANIIGDLDLAEKLSGIWNELTSMVPFYAEALPGFTQSEVYQQAFGPNSPPAEYIFTPTDLFLPAYFEGVTGTNAANWNLTQLEAMHQLAAQAFAGGPSA